MKVDLRELLILSLIPGIGATRLLKLISHFRDSHLAVSASAKDLIHVEGIEKKTALRIVSFFRNSEADQAKDFADDQLARANKANARLITFWDKDYPPNLKNIYDPPAYLFVLGELCTEDKFSVAIVGTRVASPYGTQMAEIFAQGFAKLGITTVSGLARGIDSVAHAATMKAGGRTLAVVGSGVDIVYPAENSELASRVSHNGAIISEFTMGAKPDAPNFPRRNRIISGIALGTVIIETATEGGAMITASLAFDQGREVFAVPGTVSEKRRSGTNLLIKQEKARLVESVDDIVEILGPQLKYILKDADTKRKQPLPPLSLFEQKLCDTMDDSPIHIDMLAERSGYSTADALVHLLSLEFKGIVKQNPGKMFVKIL